MILFLKPDLPSTLITSLCEKYQGRLVTDEGKPLVVTHYKGPKLAESDKQYLYNYLDFPSDAQLSHRLYRQAKRTIKLDALEIGGETNHTIMVAGPCSAESLGQLDETAVLLKSLGVQILRAGAFKPRFSPYSFQGLGMRGLELLTTIRDKYHLKIITEIRDATHAEAVIECTDVVQVGAKAMHDHGTLHLCAKANKPILIKRGYGATVQDLMQAAEFVLSGGNDQVILCERGIRTFETHTRFSLDLCGVAYLKEHSNLPIFVDPSHAIGFAYGVPDLTRASLAMGVDGIMLEVHPHPPSALSDASQQLDFSQFRSLMASLSPLAGAVGKKLI